MSFPGEFDPCGNVHDTLKAEPDRLNAGLAVAFAPEEAAELGDHAHDTIEVRRLLGQGLFGEDVCALRYPRAAEASPVSGRGRFVPRASDKRCASPNISVRRGRRVLSVGEIPTRQLSLQPVAIGAVVEVTKRPKPSV